nr:ElyC/SanA/YdcF family protein [Dysgonomonas massiliensis]
MKKQSKIKRMIKRAMLLCLAFALIIFFVIWFANWKVEHDTKDFVFDNLDSIPSQKVALIPGTSKWARGGRENLYFTNRIDAAVRLYNAGKAKAFVVSGDNRHVSYNEPRDMFNALVEKGVPDSIIYFDFAGLRTLDSVIRMKEIFSQDSFIIVSQKFQNQRAIYLAQQSGLEVYGYNAADLSLNRMTLKTKVREKLTRVKVFLDLITNKQPKHLGEKIEIKESIN